MEVLVRIKRAVLSGRFAFSEKARIEMECDSLSELDVAESIVNSVAIYKRLRSRNPYQSGQLEYLYVIQATNLEGLRVNWYGSMGRITSTSSSPRKELYEAQHERRRV